jgi:hypothetical protein
MRRALGSLALGAILFSTACNPNDLATVAKAEATLEAACNTASTVVIQANAAGLIATADATVILTGVLQVEQANGQAIAATAALNTLSMANKATLLNDLQPVSVAINNLVANGTLNIKDAATKQKVQLGLVTVQTALTAAVGILQAVK